MGIPERRKKSSGASRPIMAKTTSFASVCRVPLPSVTTTASARTSSSLQPSMTRTRAGRVRRQPRIMLWPSAVLTRSETGSSICTSARGSFSSARSLSTFSGLGRANSLPRWASVTAAPAMAERDRALQRGVAASDDEHLLAGVVLGVVEAVEDLVELLAGHAERAVIAAAADGDDDAQRPHRLAAGQLHQQLAAPPLDALDVRAPALDAVGAALRLELVEQRLLDGGGELELDPAGVISVG